MTPAQGFSVDGINSDLPTASNSVNKQTNSARLVYFTMNGRIVSALVV
jgi:hypothetical protein